MIPSQTLKVDEHLTETPPSLVEKDEKEWFLGPFKTQVFASQPNSLSRVKDVKQITLRTTQ